jgi:DNA-directed RNA polymerase specialized sigma24 family protein
MSRRHRRSRIFAAVHDRLERYVRRRARQLAGDDEDLADDLQQEALIGAWLASDARATTREGRVRRIRRAATNRMYRYFESTGGGSC